MSVLIIDGLNFMHRARSGFTKGEHNVVYNLFRNLRALVEQFQPTRVHFTLEGHPKKRLSLLPEYKANRVIDTTTEAGGKQQVVRLDFFRQVDIIVNLITRYFPITVIRQPDHEADDLVYNVIKNASSSTEFVVVSTDTDFIQLLHRFSNVMLYNPVTKAFVEAPDYDYVFWKALRGDGSDNVSKIPGISDARATELMDDPAALAEVLKKHGETFKRNVSLIRFMDFDADELLATQSSSPAKDWDAVKTTFESFRFSSMVKEPYWSRFVSTFDALWGGE